MSQYPLIQRLEPQHYAAWLPVWLENTEHSLSQHVTESTWKRLSHPTQYPDMGGFGLFLSATQIAGIIHYTAHPITGSTKNVAYMQDLYIMPPYQRKGYGTLLLKSLKDYGQIIGWERIYWFAQNSNKGAVDLYRKLSINIDFSIQIIPLD
jgi:GNAT superfamily N-acetyltransferase